MSLDEGLTRLIGRLYDAAYDRDAWRAAVAEIMHRSGSRMGVVASLDLRNPNFNHVEFHGPETSSAETGRREYRDGMYALDPTLNWARNHPGYGVCETAEIIAKSDYCEHPFLKWSRSHFGTLHWRFFYTEAFDDLSFGLSLHAPADRGAPPRQQLPLEMLLFENLERAVRLAARPPNFAANNSALIAIDATGRPLSLSQRAEEIIREANGLVIKDGVLTAQRPENARLLQRAIRAAVDLSSGELAGKAVRIGRARRKSDLLATVSHFPRSLDHLPRPAPAALVRLTEMGRTTDHLGRHSHLFDLSPRETDIASALLQGHSIESMAAMLGISRNTARNHLQALFRKTQTNRQSDLMRVLDRVARQ